MAKLIQSPSQTVGPFFHDALIEFETNMMVNEQTQGTRITVTGKVLDGDGVAVPDAVVEIWQADSQGIFNHTEDPEVKNVDPNFWGFGRSETVNEGQFSFYTVKPSASKLDGENSSPCIRMRVFARGMLIHATTRLYFADEDNSQDLVFQAVPEARRESLLAGLEPPNTYRLNIHLQGAQETVFFDI